MGNSAGRRDVIGGAIKSQNTSITNQRLEEEVGDQEAEQAQPRDHLYRHTRLGGSVLLRHCSRGGLCLAASLPLPQALICQSLLESLDLCVRIGKLCLQFVA